MAYRLQTSAPELMDLAHEPKQHTRHVWHQGCERGQLCPQLPAGAAADRARRAFRAIVPRSVGPARQSDPGHQEELRDTPTRPVPRWCKDLKQRGLLDDTLVIWGGEFGRTPMVQGGNDGRDHHNRCFSMWLAGGGVKTGHVHGQTDEFGFNVVRDPVHVHDLNATLLHLLGLDHTRLTYRFQGRDYRLTDVHGNVVRDILH